MKVILKKIIRRIQLYKRGRLLNRIFSDPTLEEYQKYDMLKLLDVINGYFERPKSISCLDVGASANEINFISRYVKNVVGINISENYLKSNSLNKNAKIMIMDGRKLKFPDNSFDLVYSINLFEHIHDISHSIDEQLRVVKHQGYCYASWYPVWSSAKGHHVMEGIVKNWEKNISIESQNYVYDGTFINDWSHLLITEDEMKTQLHSKIKNKRLIGVILDFIYDSKELNRLFFDDLLDILSEKNLEIVELNKKENKPSAEIQKKLEDMFGKKDFSTEGCQIVFKKKSSDA